jgi:hypothetical protein
MFLRYKNKLRPPATEGRKFFVGHAQVARLAAIAVLAAAEDADMSMPAEFTVVKPNHTVR